MKDIFEGDYLPQDFSLYLHRPSASDKKMAPKDCDCFYVLSPVPNLKSKINWDIEGKEYKDRILKALEKTLLPNLSKYLDVSFYMTPEDFSTDYLSYKGSGFSISPIFTQSAWFRFNNKSEDFKNLYFVGRNAPRCWSSWGIKFCKGFRKYFNVRFSWVKLKINLKQKRKLFI